MERSSEHGDLAAALAEARPTPREDFAEELDERVAAGFPRRSRPGRSPLADFVAWIHTLAPQRLLFAGGATALAAIAIATVVIASGGSDLQEPRIALDHPVPPEANRLDSLAHAKASSAERSEAAPPVSHSASSGAAEGRSYAPAEIEEFSRGAGYDHTAAGQSLNFKSLASRHRDIERSAEIGLLADPDDVAGDSAAVFDVVHDAHGIVLHSTTTSGKRAGADFDLLIPSARLGDALAAFSAIDEVGSRHEATEDITAPTVSASEKLRDSRARIDGLLARLSTAETETEMSAIEAELDRERHHASRLRSQLDKLEQRTEFSRVSVRIKTGASPTDSGGSWGIGDAFGDAGHILGIAAGVTLVGLAILAPLALIALLAWLAHRTWVRAQRRRALRDA